jgi:hypothetical protein
MAGVGLVGDAPSFPSEHAVQHADFLQIYRVAAEGPDLAEQHFGGSQPEDHIQLVLTKSPPIRNSIVPTKLPLLFRPLHTQFDRSEGKPGPAAPLFLPE